MALHRFKKGELGEWLRVIAESGEADARPADEVPADVVQALETLRCIEPVGPGRWRVTAKGELALRMEDPAAIHRR